MKSILGRIAEFLSRIWLRVRYPYKGRGYVQITGQNTYGQFLAIDPETDPVDRMQSEESERLREVQS